MATQCVCGAELEARPEAFRVTMSPCQCAKPASSRHQVRVRCGIGDTVSRELYEDRTRLGLPIQTDTEIGVKAKWR